MRFAQQLTGRRRRSESVIERGVKPRHWMPLPDRTERDLPAGHVARTHTHEWARACSWVQGALLRLVDAPALNGS